MKKCLAAMALGLLVCVTAAQAEQKLLVTEVLAPGQLEAEATFEATRTETDFALGAETGELEFNALETRYSLGYGVIEGLEVSISIPYLLNEKEEEHLDSGASATEERHGFGDLTLGAKYRVFEQEGHPFALTAGLDVKLASAAQKRGGSGTTDISPYLAISCRKGEHYTPYASYRATFVDQGEGDEHALSLGVESEYSETLTLDLLLSGRLHTAGEFTDSFESYGLEAAVYLEMGHNLYLLPMVGVERSTKINGRGAASDLSIDAATSYKGGLSLYFLY